MSPSKRLAALHELAENFGKDPKTILESVSASWGLTVFEKAQLAHELERNPPPTAAQREAETKARETARAEADRRAHETRVTQIADARRYREVSKINPFAAAEFALSRGTHVYRNPDDDPEGGPSAA